MKQRDLSYWEDLAERYFLAETTEAEEARLRRFLCSEEARDARFDEVRATMSYLYAATQKHSPKVGTGRRLAIAVAASLLVAFLGWYQYQQYNISTVRIAGQDIEEADASMLMQEQMTAMFNPLDQ